VASGKEECRVWQRFGDEIPELSAVATRLLAGHATSASTERNWSLWGRVYRAARSSQGMQRAKALIAICAAEKAKHCLNPFLLLSVLWKMISEISYAVKMLAVRCSYGRLTWCHRQGSFSNEDLINICFDHK
jgi:hypothetical protein